MRYAILISLAVACSIAPAQEKPATAPSTQPGGEKPAGKPGNDAARDEKLKQLLEMRDRMRGEREQEIRKKALESCAKGAKFLLATQKEDGSWSGDRTTGITAIVVRALVLEPSVGKDHPAVKKAVDWLLSNQREDNGIYAADGKLKNYESSVALSALAAFKDPQYAERIAKLQKFLADLQWDESESISKDNPFYGGAGYGESKRPDLSNTQIMLDALHDSGLPPDHPAYQRAVVFIQRCQMLGESNDQRFARSSTQGGFIYSPANDGESKAGTVQVDGRTELRSYGSMTYAGLKSFIYAGLSKDDPRVKAAFKWIQQNWTLSRNPNMSDPQAEEGLFYYYHTFARTLSAWGEPVMKDARGREHQWRLELAETLFKRQKEDGSWVNTKDRWMEGDPSLVTAYSILALQTAFASPAASAPKTGSGW